MKATKALKKLARIEALLSNVSERYGASDHSIQAVLQDAKDSMIRAKEAVSVHASPESEKESLKGRKPNRRRKTTKGTAGSPSHSTPEPPKPKRKLSAAGKAAIVAALKKRWAAKKAAAKKAPAVAKKAATKKVVAKKTAKKSTTKKAAKEAKAAEQVEPTAL